MGLNYDEISESFNLWFKTVKDGDLKDCEINARRVKISARAIKADMNAIVCRQIDDALKLSLAYLLNQQSAPEAPDRFLRHEAIRALNSLNAALAEAVVAARAAELRRRYQL